jgi:hypothetical protein
MHRLVLIALLTLGACAPSVDPAAKASLDGWVSGLQTSGASYDGQGLERDPPKVGQWAEYKDIDRDGAVSRRLQKVVGEEGGAYWIETELETYSGTSVMKALVASPDWRKPAGMEIRRIISQTNGEQAQELPAFLANAMAGPVTSALAADFSVINGQVETVTVPAGRFESHKLTATGSSLPLIGDTAGTAWINMAVPLSGGVRFESADGYRSELTDFGETGAESAITGPVRKVF